MGNVHIQLHALQADDLYQRLRGDDRAGFAAGRPCFAVDVHLAGGDGVVDGLGNAGGAAQHPVGVGSGAALAAQLPHQRPRGDQRRNGHDEERHHLKPDGRVQHGGDQACRTADDEPDGHQSYRGRLHHAKDDDGGDPYDR